MRWQTGRTGTSQTRECPRMLKVRQSDWELVREYTMMARQLRLPTYEAEYTYAVVPTCH